MKRAMLVLGAVLLGAILVHAEAVSGPPKPIVPEPFGVNIHFVVPNEAEVDALAAVGYRFIRMDFSWGGTERRQGEYDFSGYDKLVDGMARRNIRCLFILDYANRLYDSGAAPHSDEAQQAFARWAAAAARHYAGKGILWEIWNEPNLAQFWKPQPNADDYSRLSLRVIDAVRAADPGAYIIGPASSGFPWAFFETMARHGVFAKLDAVSVHPYRQSAPETAEADYHRLRLLLDKASPNKRLPIISGEWGYSTAWKDMTEEKQSQYIVRQWLFNLANDVHLSIWYDWKDDGPDPKEPEHHFGSVYRDLKPKPSASAARVLAQTLRGYRYVRRLATENSADYLLLFEQENRKIAIAAWTTGQSHRLPVPLPAGKVRIVSMLGQSADAQGQGLSVELTGSPQYLLPDLPPGAADRLIGWRPTLNMQVVRGGIEPTAIQLEVASGLASQPVWVTMEKQLLAHLNALSRRGGSVPVPLRLLRRDRAVGFVDVQVGSKDAGLLQSARVAVLLSNPLHAVLLPRVGERTALLVDNPSGDPLVAQIRVRGAGAAGSTSRFARGQKQAVVELPPEAAMKGVEIIDQDGQAVVSVPPSGWRSLPLGANADDWRAHTEGAREVAGEAKVSIADPPSGLPQPGLTRAVRIDYRFGAGWKYAVINPPASLEPISGKPAELGLWLYGDGSGNALRCRFRDSGGQTFQASYGNVDWTGWRWITLPIDGREAHHWGGANDGVVRYPIRWEGILLIDNSRLKDNQSLQLHAAGLAVREPAAQER